MIKPLFIFYARLKTFFATDVATGASVAIASIASPSWLPYLTGASSIAGALMPMLGVVWLAVQIWAKISETRNPKK